jgi:hypothetical protein
MDNELLTAAEESIRLREALQPAWDAMYKVGDGETPRADREGYERAKDAAFEAVIAARAALKGTP